MKRHLAYLRGGGRVWAKAASRRVATGYAPNLDMSLVKSNSVSPTTARYSPPRGWSRRCSISFRARASGLTPASWSLRAGAATSSSGSFSASSPPSNLSSGSPTLKAATTLFLAVMCHLRDRASRGQHRRVPRQFVGDPRRLLRSRRVRGTLSSRGLCAIAEPRPW